MEGLFFPAYYRRLLEHLPETRRYRELTHRDAMQGDGHSARRKFCLFSEHIMLLPAAQRRFWLELSRVLRSRALQDAFKQKFRVPLERRFGRRVERLSFYPVPILLRDLSGYRIGTILHEGRDGDAAQRTKALAFRPAAGYAFPVLRHESWHSVARTSDADGERNSLMLTYYVQDGLLSWAAQRLQRLAVFIGYGLRR